MIFSIEHTQNNITSASLPLFHSFSPTVPPSTMKLTTAVAVFITAIGFASQLNVAASSSSSLWNKINDPPQTRKVRTAIIVSTFLFSPIHNIRVTCPTTNRTLCYLIFCFVCFLIPFVAMTILLNTKIKNGKKDSNLSSGITGKPNHGSTGWYDECLAFDAPQPWLDGTFSANEIMCEDIFWLSNYCYNPLPIFRIVILSVQQDKLCCIMKHLLRLSIVDTIAQSLTNVSLIEICIYFLSSSEMPRYNGH